MRRISLTVLGPIAMLVLLPYPTSFGTSLARPPAAVNSPPAPDAGVADVAAAGGTTAMTSAMAALVQPVSPAPQREDIR
jgi:hypothetical protein